MSQIETLIFDLDETLVYPPDDGQERLDAAFELAGVEPFFTIEEFGQLVPEVDGDGALDLRLKCFRKLAEEYEHPISDAEAVARAFEMPTGSEFKTYDEATEIVLTLQDRGYNVGLVTNGAEKRQREKLCLLDLEGSFGVSVFGRPERGLKPDLEPLREALDEFGTPPEAAVKIGDSHRIDIEPANQLGMTTVWFPSEAAPTESDRADITIQHLRELLDEPWASLERS